MKTKRADLIIAILLAVIGVILAGLLIAWMTGMFKDKRQNLNSGTEKIDGAINAVADFDLLVYDGDTISGSTLMKLISDYDAKDMQISIWVHTLDNTDAYYNYAYTSGNLGSAVTVTPPAGKAASGYITPTGNFLGEVIKNTNNEIVCLKFTQQR